MTRAGFIQLEYGQRRPNEPGRLIEVGEGETLDKINFALPRMSIIAGRVTDETGEPIDGVPVYAMRWMFYEGSRRLVPMSGGSVRTDEDGEYKISRLSPGTYHIMASTTETWTISENGIETILAYMPTYFPGVTTASDASGVTVGVGQQLRAVDFPLVAGRAAKVSGIALDSTGAPFARVSLSSEVRGLGFASFHSGPDATVNPDGTFSMPNVPPGQYLLQARRKTATGEPPDIALVPLVVEGTDIDGIMLSGSAGGRVSGRIVSTDGPLPDISLIRIDVSAAYRTQPPPALIELIRRSSHLKDDWTFTVEPVFGRARFWVAVPEGWMLKSIMHEGEDISERVLEMRSGQHLSGVEVIITKQITSVEGQVNDERAAPTADATVLLFPQEPSRWYERSSSLRLVRPDRQGRWRVQAIPPGDYFAIALEYVDDSAWQDPEFLQSLSKDAKKVRVVGGSAETVQLKVVVRH